MCRAAELDESIGCSNNIHNTCFYYLMLLTIKVSILLLLERN